MIKNLFSFYFLLNSLLSISQIFLKPKKIDFNFTSTEYSLGKTAPPNTFFPDVKLQNGIVFSLGKTNYNNNLEWAYRLNFPKTGLSISYVDYGNLDKVGTALTIMPFIDFKVFANFSSKMNLKIGLGGSCFNRIYDKITNPYNKGISLNYTWAFRANLYYKILDTNNFNLKLGVGYFHNSNGHLRLPNNGLNTFFGSVSADFNYKKFEIKDTIISHFKSRQTYFNTRMGLGFKVLTKNDNKKEAVYTYSTSMGFIINKTFKYGCGFYYRFYNDYYNYIKNDGILVTENYPELKENSVLSASNIGVFVNGEILLSHFGVEMELGLNLYKPAYKIDWLLNEEKYVNGAFEPKGLNDYYKLKKIVSTRLGIKWYAINSNKSPLNNFYIGTFINANLGQADFSEITFGYIKCFKLKINKPKV